MLLNLHKEYSSIIEDTFSSDQAFFGSRDKVRGGFGYVHWGNYRKVEAIELSDSTCSRVHLQININDSPFSNGIENKLQFNCF